MQEIWKNVVDYEEKYEISNLGRIRQKYGKVRKKYLNKYGYEYTTLNLNGVKKHKTIHQLVCASFIPSFKYGMHVNHKDGNKQNNCLDNLELTNAVYNNTHAHTLSTTYKPGKSRYKNVSIKLDKRHKNPTISYVASVKINSQRHYIGCFEIEEEAGKAVDKYLDLIGDTIRLRNFP